MFWWAIKGGNKGTNSLAKWRRPVAAWRQTWSPVLAGFSWTFPPLTRSVRAPFCSHSMFSLVVGFRLLGSLQFGRFLAFFWSWSQWRPARPEVPYTEAAQNKHHTQAFNTPSTTIVACAIAVEVFFELGAFDEGMSIWGGEKRSPGDTGCAGMVSRWSLVRGWATCSAGSCLTASKRVLYR